MDSPNLAGFLSYQITVFGRERAGGGEENVEIFVDQL